MYWLFDYLFTVDNLYASSSTGQHPAQCICSSCGYAFTFYTTNGTRLIGRKEELKGVVAEFPDGIEVVTATLLHVIGEGVDVERVGEFGHSQSLVVGLVNAHILGAHGIPHIEVVLVG